MTQIFSEAVSHGGGAACQQQFHAHRATNDIRCANHHSIETEGINVVTLKQRDDTARGAGTQTRRALAQTTDVVRMETVHVFVRMNTFQHFDVINTRR